MLKQQQTQKMLQKLSPQQIQLMKLLQIPTDMLDQRIQEELEGNPALEVEEHLSSEREAEEPTEEKEPLEDDFTMGGDSKKEGSEEPTSEEYDEDYNKELEELPLEESYENYEEVQNDENYLDEYLDDYLGDDTASYKLSSNNYSSDQEEKTIPIAVESSFGEYLDRQLGMQELEKEEALIAQQIIGSIDEDGYLRRAPGAIADDLMFAENIRVGEDEVLSLGYKIIKNYFEEFSKKHYKKLLRQLSLFNEDLKAATEEILKLNPKPGSAFSSSSKLRKYIVPDFIIENKTGVLELSLNSRNAPELRVNDHYKEMLEAYSANRKDKKQREAAMFVKQKIDAARWFIDAIKQRQDTMFRTMYTIMSYQEDFFLTGDEKKLKPMILKDIAEITGLDISTVSRVANSKYVQTEFGTKRLKAFFSESLQTSTGEEVSTLEVKKILTEIIEAEDKRKPLSDEKLKNILQGRGYNIARRTVAKYREQLNISVARLRKEL